MGMVISTHLPPPVMIDSTEVLKWVAHMLCWTWAMYFSAAASSENDQGSMNLASNTASVPSTTPSSVAAIQGMAECLTRRWTSVTRRPVLRSYQDRLSSSVAAPSCTMRLSDRSSGSASPRFSRHRRTRAASSLPMMIRASEPPMKLRLLMESAKLKTSLFIELSYPWVFAMLNAVPRQQFLLIKRRENTVNKNY